MRWKAAVAKTGEEPANITAARLRQDIKSDIGAAVDACVNERFSRFLSDGLP